MIKDIIQYPTPLSVQYATDVRLFNDDLFSLIDDLKDSMNENNLEGLAAFQIGSYYNVIVVKDENGEILELVNPRLITHKGSIETQESTAYYPGRSAKIKRYEEISIVYQDRNGTDKSLQASGSLAIVLQRKIDYTFGASFIHKMSKTQKEMFENGLDFSGDVGVADYCPTTFKRDKIIVVINVVMILMLLNLIASFFISDASILSQMFHGQMYAALSVVVLNIIYFFYAQYEGKLYVSCNSCQIGNIIGTTAISLVKLSLLSAVSYFFIT